MSHWYAASSIWDATVGVPADSLDSPVLVLGQQSIFMARNTLQVTLHMIFFSLTTIL